MRMTRKEGMTGEDDEEEEKSTPEENAEKYNDGHSKRKMLHGKRQVRRQTIPLMVNTTRILKNPRSMYCPIHLVENFLL